MQFAFNRPNLSITESVCESPLEDYVVLLGPNGAGKSHLIASISSGAITVDDISHDLNRGEILRFDLGQLTPSAGQQPPSQFRDVWTRLKPVIDSVAQQYGLQNASPALGHQQAVNFNNAAAQQLSLPLGTVESMQTTAGKALWGFTSEDFRDHFPLHATMNDLFRYSLTEAFLEYFSRWDTNKYQKFLNLSEEVPEATWIEDEEFLARYGRTPWEILDEALDAMGLTYSFEKPANLPLDLPYEPRLVANDTGVSVTLEVLSSGEKTLLSLALALYASDHIGSSLRKPQLLLLDEADASLHPSMIQSLLSVTRDVLHGTHGLKIILATHSPTTVALAPEESLYALSRTGRPRLKKVSREKALSELTVGLPTLSVRIEDRRQVFVESEKDEARFDMLHRVLKTKLGDYPFTPHFIASGRGGAGNSAAVLELVRALHQKGNTSVRGVVDRDSRQSAPPFVHYMSERYSIENYLLDPLLVGSLLIRARIVSPGDMGLPPEVRFFEVGDENLRQIIVDYVYQKVQSALSGADEVVSVSYVGGYHVMVSRRYLDTQGHALEEALRVAFPGFQRFPDLPFEVCKTVALDAPDLIPSAVLALLEELSSS